MFRKFTGFLFIVLAALLVFLLLSAIVGRPEDESLRILPALLVLFFLLADVYVAYYLISNRSWKRRHSVLLILVLVISVLMISYFIMVAYVDHKLKGRSYTGVYDDCRKIWAARGLVVEGPDITPDGTQNSIESITLAFSKGARGVEVDHYFDIGLNQFIVSHDRPYNLKNGSLLTLEALFNATDEQGYYWLDFKKLRHLNKNDAHAAVQRLEAITKKHGLKKRIYVEGEDPINLSLFHQAGFNIFGNFCQFTKGCR